MLEKSEAAAKLYSSRGRRELHGARVASILTMAHQQQMLHAERWMSRAAELQESCPFTLLHGICSVLVVVGINSNCGMDSGVLRAHPPLPSALSLLMRYGGITLTFMR